MDKNQICVALFVSLSLQASIQHAHAQTSPSFYAGKTLRVIVGTTPGGGYDIYARLFARYFGKHLPGHPTVIVENMPGAGGYRAAQYADHVAPKDGTVVLLIVQTAVVDTMLETQHGLNPSRLNWIGRLTSNVAVGSTSQAFGAENVDALRKRKAVFGGTGHGDTTDYIPKLLNKYAGTQIRVVPGYPGSAELTLAMSRGEIDGQVGSWTALKTQHASELAAHKITVLFQMALKRHGDLSNVPTIEELAKNESGKSALHFISSSADIGRSIVAPTGVPADRVTILRAAFDETVADPALKQEAHHMTIDLESASGLQLQQIVADTLATPKDILPEIAKAVR